ncbi:RagB/SusD family nutrient uptake outer membrane protein [Flavobacterium sp. Fl-77]|uniref:RagB/SusD family nutrient uptake outer membrane protein n=1 Tax=Flavobacterium flavipigmentatum TaxID=2893884 RepID=A0AAJ2SBC9_9FLAO|nr:MULTISPECIES: RagB/SusD family nutrient uptake outer membrane protein [unclassified Flavobacterium]MDX6183624.1 RagB/SusD family nutrient uptake outer membrane protein [Flavobacterium sp. Fl-33]MDX6187176.1 RagB/SusD family nutrient uptake outer membrane protein [Flavobacterium sp. Fl-77]UFH38013.1 RagB/SusD family nutrient uptake outer membrane protein [Flavobacterium sp. F-70]
MKKIIIILGIVMAAFTSCSDYIEEESLSYVPADETYKTASGFQLLINANYAWLKGIYGGNPWLFESGTDMYAEGRTPEPAGLSQYTLLIPSSSNVDELYISCYQQIQSVNKTLYYSTVTEQTSNLGMLVGEARYLRANAYFLLVQTYGGVPIVNEHVTAPILSFTRNTAEEVYTQIITDLEASLASVGTGPYAATGKVNKRAVNDLLAKVYLTRGYETFGTASDFTKAASYADAAIAGQALNIPFSQLFAATATGDNDLNAETIFSVQYDKASTSTDPTRLGNNQFYYFSSYLGGSETGAPLRSYNLCPTTYALGLYEKGDKRWEATFMTEVLEETVTTNGAAKTTLYYPYYRPTNPAAVKVRHFYEPKWFTPADKTAWLAANASRRAATFVYHPWGEYGADHTLIDNRDCYTIPVKKFDDANPTTPVSTGPVSTRDIILSRLGETYLIAAEAYLKAGIPTTGLDRLNEVRRRAGVANATLGEFNIDYILDERGRELVGEYKRWFDLKRTGTLVARASLHNYKIKAANFVGIDGALKILRPIPQTALDLNQNKDFPQNPGY